MYPTARHSQIHAQEGHRAFKHRTEVQSAFVNASVPEWPNGAVCKTVDSLVRIQPDAPPINICNHPPRDSEAVKHESHKLESQVRFLVPQPSFTMKYTIIEDCSPYYIRFTHAKIEDVIQRALHALAGVSLRKENSNIFPQNLHSGFNHHKPTQDLCDFIHASVPINHELDLNPHRAAMFITEPRYYYRAHKDLDNLYSVNYHIQVLDQKCVTSWYSEDDCQQYKIDPLLTKVSRDCKGFDKSKHTALKTMIAKQGECCLFNTDIWHDWDNSKSENFRIVMTLRDRNPSAVSFFDAKYKLFGY